MFGIVVLDVSMALVDETEESVVVTIVRLRGMKVLRYFGYINICDKTENSVANISGMVIVENKILHLRNKDMHAKAHNYRQRSMDGFIVRTQQGSCILTIRNCERILVHKDRVTL